MILVFVDDDDDLLSSSRCGTNPGGDGLQEDKKYQKCGLAFPLPFLTNTQPYFCFCWLKLCGNEGRKKG